MKSDKLKYSILITEGLWHYNNDLRGSGSIGRSRKAVVRKKWKSMFVGYHGFQLVILVATPA